MQTWIALLRGVNVGGVSLPMKALAATLEKAGFVEVRTYIQSGNLVFRSPPAKAVELEQRIRGAILKANGFGPRTLVLSAAQLKKAAAANPFPEAEALPTSLHLFFLDQPPRRADLVGLERAKAASERFQLKGRVLYVHAPEGFGRSKLAQQAERLLGVDATARNWRTVTKLIEMAAGA